MTGDTEEDPEQKKRKYVASKCSFGLKKNDFDTINGDTNLVV
jgi:hypothetical protein